MKQLRKTRVDVRVVVDGDSELANKIEKFASTLPMGMKHTTLMRHLLELGVDAALAGLQPAGKAA